MELNQPGRTIVWVNIPSQVGIEGNPPADLLVNAGRLTGPFYPSQQHGPEPCEQQGESPPPPKEENPVEHLAHLGTDNSW